MPTKKPSKKPTKKPAKSAKKPAKPAKPAKKLAKPAKPAKKPVKKPAKKPKKFTGPLANLVACRTRPTKATAWMPDVCYLSVHGESTAILSYCGWSTAPSDAYRLDWLARDLWHLAEEWASEVGKGWRLEARLVNGEPVAIPTVAR